ncbi:MULTISPECIES: PD-(D/E)XK nuclease family protein [unclassified Paenibacillus]|uniref:PD-(D/E)XK nuclease family protein n=1 Tax=unclassified Paenibacillus TaxID=185978 RepID=UPI001AEB32ED|nr:MULTISPECIES: PD-(D/E)XK nuclease family protein [unclassified Paenibacillus]MBP1153964.1 hypothetical protein [Paenibacillus sp. PvP091]MBP1170651.1 hypothetical protein [Paenibacillus sp. PvR098]MBP2441679.1 hypothetical protein [Paenibacillus sp. PvP052]
MNGNFVSIIGYQFERVHTGVISWILETKNVLVTMDRKYEVLRRIYRMCNQTINFKETDIQNITCSPEYSFGRKRKIDLVVRVDLNNQSTKYLVIEMKVDSIPYSEQLNGTRNDFLQDKNCNPDDASFLLFLFGSAQVCVQPVLHSFIVFRLPEIREVFSGLYIDHHVYDDWIEALTDEDFRRMDIMKELEITPKIFDEKYWKGRGYHLWFPLFYYIYFELKRYSKYSVQWDIYSGSNNPVMNWRDGWLKKKILGYNVEFYWEFNYEDFILKVLLDENNKMPQDDLNWLRDEIATFCNYETMKCGKSTQNRYGKFNSLYKWKFDFKTQDFAQIMKEVDEILDKVHPKVISL